MPLQHIRGDKTPLELFLAGVQALDATMPGWAKETLRDMDSSPEVELSIGIRVSNTGNSSRITPALGAHPVRGKGRAHPPKQTEGYEPSFSLIRADSRQ
jgi:hypothetical protein